jgi:hypothetical protein
MAASARAASRAASLAAPPSFVDTLTRDLDRIGSAVRAFLSPLAELKPRFGIMSPRCRRFR